VFSKLAMIGVYVWAFEHFRVTTLPTDTVWIWPVALVLYDLLYYFHHRYAHEVGVLWAAHVVHHQSEEYNLSTALRQTSTDFLFGWLFFLPMALLDPEGWAEAGLAPEGRDASQWPRAFERFQMRQRQFTAVLNAHGIVVTYDHCPKGRRPQAILSE